MDNAILKKRLNTFKAGKSGRLQDISDEVIVAVHRAWENWPGTTADFCREVGIKPPQMNVIIKSGKKLIKNGVVTESEFQEIAATTGAGGVGTPCSGIELSWQEGRVIRFPGVDDLVDFLKKAA
jgi:hypothetical protein